MSSRHQSPPFALAAGDVQATARRPWLHAGFGLLAFALGLAAFSPRFAYWSMLDYPPSPYAEVNRAIASLRQLHDPFVALDHPSNQVIRWRLLFPFLGHYVHLPERVYLALPFVGCWLVLCGVSALLYRETGRSRTALLAAAAAGTMSWFLVSTGWLAYFDAWYILGILALSFSSSRIALALACLLTPWIDERFVLCVPLGLVVRGVYLRRTGLDGFRDLRADGLLVLCLVAPYVALRLFTLGAGLDRGSSSHIQSHLAFARDPVEIAVGCWMGMRALWLFGAVAVACCFLRRQRLAAWLLIAVTAATLAVILAIAKDISRSVSSLIPLVLLGIILLERERPRRADWLVAAVVVLNLALPVRHVVAGFHEQIPIRTLFDELGLYRRPTKDLAVLCVQRGDWYSSRRAFSKALPQYEAAIRIDPASATAWVKRGLGLRRVRRFDEAFSSLDEAIKLDPGDSAAYYFRGMMRRDRADLPGAVADLARALELTPGNDPNRATVEETLKTTRRRLRGD